MSLPPLSFFFTALTFQSCSYAFTYNELSDAEKEIFVSVEDLADFGLEAGITSEKASVRKMRMPGILKMLGGRITYEYSIEGDGYYIQNEITNPGIVSRYINGYIYDRFFSLAFKHEGLTLKELKKFSGNYTLYIISHKEMDVGNYVVYRESGIEYKVCFAGLVFDDPGQWDEYFSSKISKVIKLQKDNSVKGVITL